MNSETFIKYEVIYWIAGFIIRRTLANTVFPLFGMACYESSKDVSLLVAKILIARATLKPLTGKEIGQSDPQTKSNLTEEDKDGNPQN
jgi:hypothetical protein